MLRVQVNWAKLPSGTLISEQIQNLWLTRRHLNGRSRVTLDQGPNSQIFIYTFTKSCFVYAVKITLKRTWKLKTEMARYLNIYENCSSARVGKPKKTARYFAMFCIWI